MPTVITTPGRFTTDVDEPFLGDVDLVARIALVPDTNTTKGVYFDAFLSQLPDHDQARVWPLLRSPPRHGRYQAFLDYPFADVLLWLSELARKKHPGKSPLEGLRLIGRDTVKIFLTTQAGKVVKSIKRTARESLLNMPEVWRRTDPQNRVEATELSPQSIRFEVDGFPGWLDSGLLGTLEQVVMNHHGRPVLDVELRDVCHGTVVVRW
jgi:uncharacterized protein (TIGR02265 family)